MQPKDYSAQDLLVLHVFCLQLAFTSESDSTGPHESRYVWLDSLVNILSLLPNYEEQTVTVLGQSQDNANGMLSVFDRLS